jgi:hypothetical protein
MGLRARYESIYRINIYDRLLSLLALLLLTYLTGHQRLTKDHQAPSQFVLPILRHHLKEEGERNKVQ